jgi:hypothetical protein
MVHLVHTWPMAELRAPTVAQPSVARIELFAKSGVVFSARRAVPGFRKKLNPGYGLIAKRREPRRHARPVFLKRKDVATRNIRLGFIDESLCPRKIILFDFALRKALVKQSPRGLLDRGKVASRDKGV